MKTSLGKKSGARTDETVKTSARRNLEIPAESSIEPASGAPTTQGSPASPGEPVVLTNATVLAAHVTWMLYGPFILFLILISIVRLGSGWLTALDIAYFVVVAAMIFCRWFDQRSGQACTTTGEPSTWEDFRRYALLLPPLAIGAWILSNLLGNHWFQGGAGL